MIRSLLFRQENRNKIAVIEEDQSLSYRDLARKAASVQKQLPEKQQENIAILLPNGGDYIAALFGTFMSGMTAFPLSVQLTKHEIMPLLTEANIHTIITSLEFGSFFSGIAKCPDHPLQVIYMERLALCEDEDSQATVNACTDEPMILLNTSGTTGNAKIVQLSEKNVETAVLGYLTYIDYSKLNEEEIKYILGTPFSSVYGLLILSACLVKSFPIVVPKETLSLDVFYKVIEKYKVTHYEGGAAIPILMDQMSARKIPYDISSLKFIGFGGSKITSDVLRRLSCAFPNIEVCTGYGQTESASLIARPHKRVDMDKLDSVGIAIPGVTIKVEAGGVITGVPRVIGEVVVKGPNVMLGYYKKEKETLKIIKDGYLYTGDIGYLDEDGYLYLCGRKKNVIMVRGFSVYAEEVESCLLASGLVSDCIVRGETDGFGNEIVCADIVLDALQVQIEDIRLYCADHLAAYKQPQKIQIVEEIKKTATGKSERTKFNLVFST